MNKQNLREAEVKELGEIRALDFQRYAVATGDMNPLYFDEDAARSAGHPGIVAPPNYLSSVLHWDVGPTDDRMRADGTERGMLPPELEGMRLMGGGHQLTLGQPVRPGDRVTARRSFVEQYQRESKLGRLHFAVYEIVYTNQRSEHLVTCRHTIIAVE